MTIVYLDLGPDIRNTTIPVTVNVLTTTISSKHAEMLIKTLSSPHNVATSIRRLKLIASLNLQIAAETRP